MFAFVSLPFEEVFAPVFETISKAVVLRGLNAIRSEPIDERITPPAMAAVETHIRNSRLVIADLTGSCVNVLQAVRYASGLGKPRILISQEEPEKTAFHAQGVNIYPYDLEDLDSLQSLLLKLAADLSTTEAHGLDDAGFHGSISAKVGLMHIVPSQWKNPFAGD